MTPFWRLWLVIWCWSVILFGAILVGGGLEATSGPTQLLFQFLNPGQAFVPDQTLRFSLGVMGAVSVGWGVGLMGAIQVATDLGDQGTKAWRWIMASALIWFCIDSPMSVATGFGLNVIPNIILLSGLLIPIWRCGLLVGKPIVTRSQ